MMTPRSVITMPRTDQQKLSDRQEKRLASSFGGRVNPGSGSSWRRRQDVRTDKFLIEAKRTGKTQITVKASDWKQLLHHALTEDKVPVMALDLDGKHYVMVLEDDWIELTNE
jgi:hypothetical protein